MRTAAASPDLSRRHRARVLVAVLAIVLAACTGDELPEVTVERVEAGEVTSTVSAPATVEPAARQDVTAGVSGVVVAVEVADGKRVRADRPVLRLSSAQVDLARRQAAAAADAAAGVGGVAVDGSAAATLAATADAVADYDAKTLPRLRAARRRAKAVRAADQRAAALVAVAAVEASYESTRAALLASGRALAASQQATADALASALNQVLSSAGASQRLQAQAAAAAADRQADELVVRAPFTGTVQLGQAAAAGGPDLPADLAGAAGLTDLAGAAGGGLPGLGGADEGTGTLRVGAPVTAGQTLFTVYDLRDYYVGAEVDEIDAPLVRAGQRADVIVDAFGDTVFEEVVESVGLAADRTQAGGVGYPVRIRILEPADREPRRRLRVGMTASAEITTQTVRADLVVPSRALLREESGDVVYVVRDGRAEVVAVEVAALGEERAAVSGDLRAGDAVVVTGYEELSDGAEVRVR